MKKLSRAFILVLVLLATFAVAPIALAHPLGNFSINRYSRLEVGQKQIDLFYVVDMAEIPAFQERSLLDVDNDGAITAAEQEQYLQQQLPTLADNLHLVIDGRTVELEPHSQQLTFPPGQAKLSTLRLAVHFIALLPAGPAAREASYRDDNYAGRLGWQEVVVRHTAETRLLASSVPAWDISDELRRYPDTLLENPSSVNRATFRFATDGALSSGPLSGEQERPLLAAAPPGYSQDNFADLLSATLNTPGAIVLTLMVAFGLGAAHALTPGHGKTIVGAYLVGSRGTGRHALFLGLTTTITHTAGVFAFGLLVLAAARFVLPEQLYPWLGVMSGLLVVVIGFALFGAQVRKWRRWQAVAHSHNTRLHYHPNHDHEHGDGHHHHHHGRAHHDHKHSHVPAAGEEETVSWRGLLALGVSGGLLPCPSALVLLLSAVALGRVGLGLVLIVAFSLGLATVLTAVGLLLVYAGRLFERIPAVDGRWQGVLPVGSALFITIVGLGITLEALLQTGVL